MGVGTPDVLARRRDARADCLGTLSFGGVYPWAFLPLFAGCAAAGSAALLRRNTTGKTEVTLAAALALLVAGVGVQCRCPSASSAGLAQRPTCSCDAYAIGYPTSIQSHALSIEPHATTLALAAVVALGVFIHGLARALTRDDTV